MRFFESNPAPQPVNLRTGWDGHRVVNDLDFAGRTFDLSGTEGGHVTITVLTADTADWTFTTDAGVTTISGAVVDFAEMREGVVFFDTWSLDEKASISGVLDLASGAALWFASLLGERDGAPNMRVWTEAALIEGLATADTVPFAPTRDLIGKRAVVAYEDDHILEHFYFSTQVVGWQLLKGKNRGGSAQADEAVYYKIAEDLYFLGWVEFRPISACLLLDYRQKRNVGKVFAWDDYGLTNERAGATILSFGELPEYPENAEPV
jgi:hypothetical protein